ncbi:YbhB/YbcL family Raf kinase inhibitor-like protein [Chelativorans salis]|uniref:YbhB/YbcL family Raf kinase inhibitor-like protein n=1 Tax=Chelativorans salis TaxID=2978478 RepID=A0ABT2LIY4_9HYPH|nr:YbhB/YbcL family Raf kinase inhibitor-like protein [Chelativorans sp. EGI FJ00035]MCT7374206.1 YbhB/YbcL family Raf kinase inhibitor-like protein [Chelativorans sp. EGI FJ00035]
MEISSPSFSEGTALPIRYAKDGENISPPLEWAGVPEETHELALLFEQVTPQTRKPFVQWLVYGLPPQSGGLPEGYQHKRDPEPEEMHQGVNDIGNVGYDGPLGTAGRTLHCRFRLLALDQPLHLPPGADRETVLSKAAEHILAEAELNARYERPR